MRYKTTLVIALATALLASGGCRKAAPGKTVSSEPAQNRRSGEPSAITYEYAGEWGKEGNGKGEFHLPVSVTATPDGKVYVADSDDHRIQYFTPTGAYLGEWDLWATTERFYYFLVPEAISAGPDGRIFAAEGPHLIVSCFSETGDFLDDFHVEGPSDEEPQGCMDVVVRPTRAFYVTYLAPVHVQYFSPEGSFLGRWGREGSGPGEFNSDFLSIALLPGGDVVVSDRGNHRIQRFSASGSFICTWGSEGKGEGEFKWPVGLAVDPNGTVYVADSGNNRVQYFTDTGSFLGSIGNEGDGPGQFNYPTDVALGEDGVLYVVDTHNHRIQYFRPVSGDGK